MKVLVLGSGGMAGHMIYNVLKSKGGRTIHGITGSKELDLTKKLPPKGYDVVVNCVGVLKPDAEKDMAKTVYLNSYLPHLLSQRYPRVIHLSTDCVFSGDNGPYRSDAKHDAADFYGCSKSLGELDNDKDLTIRTSIIGPELRDGSGLFNWFMKQKVSVNGFQSHIWNGITTLRLAEVVDVVIDRELFGGVLQPTINPTTKAELLECLADRFGKTVKVKKIYDDAVVDRSLVNNTFGRESDFGDMLFDLYWYMNENKKKYKRYL